MKKKFMLVSIVAVLAAGCLYCGCSKGGGTSLSDGQSASESSREQSSQDSEEMLPEETLKSNPDSSWAVGRFPVSDSEGDR